MRSAINFQNVLSCAAETCLFLNFRGKFDVGVIYLTLSAARRSESDWGILQHAYQTS
jgi:hypothetical protein